MTGGGDGLRPCGGRSPTVTKTEAVARNPDLEGLVADVRCLPFPGSLFDAVLSGSTLDHFASEAEIAVALRELARVLRPGDTLFLTLDSPGTPLIWLRNGPLSQAVRRMGIVPYQVDATLHRRPLCEALLSAGFEVRQMTAVLHCPRVMAVALAGPVRLPGARCQEVFLRMLRAFEVLQRLPTRWGTGHYLAAQAVHRTGTRLS